MKMKAEKEKKTPTMNWWKKQKTASKMVDFNSTASALK